jgi:signal transduction histidine kinase
LTRAVRPERPLLRSRTFRLTLVYLCFLILALAGVLGLVYWSTTAAVSRQIETTIDAELTGLAEQFRQRGLVGLMQAIRRRSADNDDGRALYLLTDDDYEPLAGNLNRWPDGKPDAEGWVTFRMENPSTARGFDFGRARVFDLGGRYHLLVGHDVREETFVAGLVRGTLVWALVIVVAVTVLGGVLLSRMLLSRIETINRTSRDIMAGDLSRRIPESGSGDEFDALARNLNAMLEQIESLITGMRQVSDNIAHDLRSPLARLRSRLEVALIEARDVDSYREVVKDTIEETDHLLATFKALLSIAEAEAGAAKERFGEVRLDRLLDDVADLYAPLVEEAGLRFDCGSDAAAVEGRGNASVLGDRDLLFQALANLIDNAIKYGASGGVVVLSMQPLPDEVRITVSDRGPGIPETDRPKVLERFHRLEPSRTTKGSGLGLSLAAAVARLHGGELRLADNAPGLAAVLVLPRHASKV